MTIRTFQLGDDVAQVSIYNEAASALPAFKPATVDEVRRRCSARDFDPATRIYAVADGRPVAYISYQANGRIGYPWCRRGHEGFAETLFHHAVDALRQRGIRRAFAAYRADWPQQGNFFLTRGFAQTREMLNYVLELVEMPTPAALPSLNIGPLTPADLPRVIELGAGVLRITDPAVLESYLFHNPLFPPRSLFALRHRSGEPPVGVALVVTGTGYAHPTAVDSAQPCFRLGAFGTEGMSTKRINGLFSLLVAPDARDLNGIGVDLLTYASHQIEDTEVDTFAAQVPSDAPHLARFYKSLFRRQGSFPIFERDL
ncbi:MAG: hypothetical protein U0736_15350 [Gemmataceae bacterium]